MSKLAKQSIKSSWTPLTNEETNLKMFEERRSLVVKWYEKWSDEQRKIVINDIVNKSKAKQIDFTADLVHEKRPIYKDDFTRVLPRVLSIYVLSFLDPRSLCRCSQVSWCWKTLSEVDHLWMPKCLRLGWVLSFSPSPYESGVWKRLYIENILALKCMMPSKKASKEGSSLTGKGNDKRHGKTGHEDKSKRPPWKGSDPNPMDTWRNNYLENEHDVEKVQELRKKHVYGPIAEAVINKAKTKVRTGQHAAMIKAVHDQHRAYSSGAIDGRPDWAQRPSSALPLDTRRPAPDASASAQIMQAFHQRSNREPSSSALLKGQPWQSPEM